MFLSQLILPTDRHLTYFRICCCLLHVWHQAKQEVCEFAISHCLCYTLPLFVCFQLPVFFGFSVVYLPET
ncbi:hypothetical protein VNO80_28400 [Phaseolus coccineus]|uniref:Uncharacterized protein n=1 Tax=Phaseolus coccineus TaxID=3886 RepID=A0AAN9LCE9_PHACN